MVVEEAVVTPVPSPPMTPVIRRAPAVPTPAANVEGEEVVAAGGVASTGLFPLVNPLKITKCARCDREFEALGLHSLAPACTICHQRAFCCSCTRNVRLTSRGKKDRRPMCLGCVAKVWIETHSGAPPGSVIPPVSRKLLSNCLRCGSVFEEKGQKKLAPCCTVCHERAFCVSCTRNVRLVSRGEKDRRPVCLGCIETLKAAGMGGIVPLERDSAPPPVITISKEKEEATASVVPASDAPKDSAAPPEEVDIASSLFEPLSLSEEFSSSTKGCLCFRGGGRGRGRGREGGGSSRQRHSPKNSNSSFHPIVLPQPVAVKVVEQEKEQRQEPLVATAVTFDAACLICGTVRESTGGGSLAPACSECGRSAFCSACVQSVQLPSFGEQGERVVCRDCLAPLKKKLSVSMTRASPRVVPQVIPMSKLIEDASKGRANCGYTSCE